jgi:UDPglucose 6-dehydrogenase
VGVTERLGDIIQDEIKQRGVHVPFDVVSNPEFLREGAAIVDFMHPERIIIGLHSDVARSTMAELFKPIMRHPEKIYFMSIRDAEMTKYAANAMLATKISFMNEIALLCERMGVDVDNVRLGMGSDSRIGEAFIYPGCGYGGSCFPKDIKALIHMAQAHQVTPLVLRAVEERNYHQQRLLAHKIQQHFGDDLSNLRVGVWGLSFKPDTDDLREASALVLLEQLLAHNVNIQVFDPVAIPAAKRVLPSDWLSSNQLHFMENQYEALRDVDALVLVTEWKPFCYPDLAAMKRLMRQRVIFDGRNQYDPNVFRAEQFAYYGIGR